MENLNQLLTALDAKVASNLKVVKSETLEIHVRPMTANNLTDFVMDCADSNSKLDKKIKKDKISKSKSVSIVQAKGQEDMFKLFGDRTMKLIVDGIEVANGEEAIGAEVFVKVVSRLTAEESSKLIEDLMDAVGLGKLLENQA